MRKNEREKLWGCSLWGKHIHSWTPQDSHSEGDLRDLLVGSGKRGEELSLWNMPKIFSITKAHILGEESLPEPYLNWDIDRIPLTPVLPSLPLISMRGTNYKQQGSRLQVILIRTLQPGKGIGDSGGGAGDGGRGGSRGGAMSLANCLWRAHP